MRSKISLITTKLLPPDLPPMTISRERLITLLGTSVERRLTVVSAPAGYGKTTLLRQFADTYNAVTWYRLDRRDRDLSTFVLHLMTGFARQIGGFCDELKRSLSEGQAAPAGVLLNAIVNELAEREAQPMLVLLDNYDDVERSKHINWALDYLLRYLPTNVHLIVSCRGVPNLECLTTLRANRLATIIGEPELRFTRTETVQLFERLGQAANGETVDATLAKTLGWVVGLLALVSSQGGTPRAKGTDSNWHVGQQDNLLSDYLKQQVIGKASSDLLSFLTRASILSRLSGDLCDAVLGTTNSSLLLLQAEAKGLFLNRLSIDSFELHPIFREFLAHRLSRDPDDLRELHRRAARHFESSGNLAEAVDHYIQAEDYETAVRIVCNRADEWLKADLSDRIIGFVDRLPTAIRVEHPDLVMAVANAFKFLGKLDEAVAHYDKAYDLYRQNNDWVHASEALCSRFEITIVGQSILPNAEALKCHSLSGLRSASALDNADSMRSQAVYNLSGGDSDSALGLYQSAMQIYTQDGNRVKQLDALVSCGVYIHWVRGEFTEVLNLLQIAEELARDLGDHYRLAECYSLRAIYLQHMGRYEECLRNAQVGISLARQIKSIFQEARALSAIAGAMYQTGGDPALALERYQQAVTLARSGGIVRIVVVSLLGIAEIHRRQGDHELAVGYARQAVDLVAGGGDPWLHSYSLSCLGATQSFAEPEEALRVLSVGLSFFIRVKDKYNLAWTHFWLALVYRTLGNVDSQQRHLQACLDLTVANDYVRVFGDEPHLSAQLLADALGWGIQPDFVEKTLAQLGERATEAILLKLPNYDERARAISAFVLGQIGDLRAVYSLPAMSRDSSEEVRREALEAISVLRNRPLPSLKIRLLGPFIVHRGEHVIDTGIWKRRKAVSLLACLALNRKQGIHRDVLIDTLFPEMDCEAARNNLYVTIHQLRDYLDPLSQKSESWQYVTCNNDHYFLYPGPNGLVDVEAFRDALGAAKLTSDIAERIAKYEAASKLYAGDLLASLPYEEWCMAERQELAELHLGCLAKLAELYSLQGDCHSAELRYRKILAIDNTREDVHRQLILLYGKTGNRPAAARQYRECVRVLGEEFSISPSPATTAAFKSVVSPL